MAAAAPDPAEAANAAARRQVSQACDALVTRQHFFAIFDEARGASDYARWRKDLAAFVEPAGPDFTKALFFNGSIDQARPYTDDLVNADTAASRPTLTMAQMRQHALLAVIRQTLPRGGVAMRLIAGCSHAGGVVYISLALAKSVGVTRLPGRT